MEDRPLKFQLIYASGQGLEQYVKKILEQNVIQQSWILDWAMDSAADIGDEEIVKMLLDAGATSYNTSLNYAVNGGYLKIVEWMLEKGANSLASASLIAFYRGYYQIYQLLENTICSLNR